MQCVKLTQLLNDAPVLFVSNKIVFNSLAVFSISTDSRSIKKNDLFIALPGEKYDGHSFIDDAIRGGAGCIIFENQKIKSIERQLRDSSRVLFVGVPDTRKIFGKIAENYLELFSLKKIVITGSAGKSTTKRLISSVLSQRYTVVSSAMSFNNDVGVPKTVLTVDDNTDMLIQEFGTNYPGEITYLSNIVHQDYALITNIGPAHIGFFGNEENIAREKKCAVDMLGQSGIAFLNAEDKYFRFLGKGISTKIKSFGLNKGDLYPERIIKIDVYGSEFILAGKKIKAKVLGEHGILNATAAALLGLTLGLTKGEIKAGIESYTEEKGRGNIYTWKGVTIIDESYNANPLSVSASLNHIGKISIQGKKIFIFGDMLELGNQSEFYHRKIAEEIIKRGITSLYTYGQKARVTGDALREAGHTSVFNFLDIDELVNSLRKEVKIGDIILVKGSRNMELEEVINELIKQ